jgi:ABC-type sugar transport system ATPase subunit
LIDLRIASPHNCQLHQRLGTTIVYVTYDQTEAMSLVTKVSVMNGGVISAGQVHRISNPGDETLVLIEVQLGEYLAETDITRLDNGHV